MGARVPNKEIILIFDKLDRDELGLLAHDDVVAQLFPSSHAAASSSASSRRSSRSRSVDTRAESDIRVALRKRPDLLEELVSQLKGIEAQSE